MHEIVRKAEQDMKRSTEALTKTFSGVRTGRASLALLEGIQVDYHGSMMALHQVANLATPERRLMTIQPWEPHLIPAIEKAILKSDLGITPSSDGKMVRLAVPILTEERRKDLVKVCHKMAEEGRVAIRSLRRDANEALKKQEKAKTISEDDLRKGTDLIQELTNKMIKYVDDLLAKKEKEILEF